MRHSTGLGLPVTAVVLVESLGLRVELTAVEASLAASLACFQISQVNRCRLGLTNYGSVV